MKQNRTAYTTDRKYVTIVDTRTCSSTCSSRRGCWCTGGQHRADIVTPSGCKGIMKLINTSQSSKAHTSRASFRNMNNRLGRVCAGSSVKVSNRNHVISSFAHAARNSETKGTCTASCFLLSCSIRRTLERYVSLCVSLLKSILLSFFCVCGGG